ncbi:quinone oxidoreductase family protein, partial [Amycolatopsis rhizosphaerae]|uniref:quinone oxidoreductase family protein n=1 Tax=Amycolatopsis rhizosphaerae TaxID=2053003 RepID=UPI001C98D514
TLGGGGLAEVAVASADLTVAVPSAVSFDVAAAVPLGVATAVLLLERAGLKHGESVLMHSASGGIGALVSQVARTMGSGERIGTVGRADKVAAGLGAGWDSVFARDDQTEARIREIAPQGVDVILDPTGSLLELDLSVAAPGGRVVLFGNATGGALPPLPPTGRLIGGNVGLLGFSISRLAATSPATLTSALRKGLQLIEAGTVRVETSTVDSLASVAGIHDLLAAGRGSGKYVVDVKGR